MSRNLPVTVRNGQPVALHHAPPAQPGATYNIYHVYPPQPEVRPEPRHPAPADDTDWPRVIANLLAMIFGVMLFIGMIVGATFAIDHPRLLLSILVGAMFIIVCINAVRLASIKGNRTARWLTRDW